MADITIKSETSTDVQSDASATTSSNPMEKTQITNSPVSPVNVQSAIIGSVVSTSDGSTVRVTIVEQIGVVASPQSQPQGISTPANYPNAQYQAGSSPVAFLPPSLQTIIQNQYPPSTNSPNTSLQNYQQATQVTQINVTQSYQQNTRLSPESVREPNLSQSAIPSSTLPNQIQNALASLFQSSQTSNDPLPTQLFRLNQSNAANPQTINHAPSAQEQNTLITKETQKQVTVTVEQNKDTITTKIVETKTEPQKLPNESVNGEAKGKTPDATQREITVRVSTESASSSPQTNLSADTLAGVNKSLSQANSNLTNTPTSMGSSISEVRSITESSVPRGSEPIARRDNLQTDPPLNPLSTPQPGPSAQPGTPLQTPNTRPQEIKPIRQEQQAQQQRVQDENSLNNERVRNIQQIIVIEREQGRPPTQSKYENSPLSPSIKPEPTNIALERTRESIIEKLTSIQSRIELTPKEQRRQIEIQGDIDKRVQGRDMLARPLELPASERRTPLSTKLADKISDSQSANFDKAISPRNISPREDRLANLIDILKRFSERSVNFKLLGKMDTSLEKACLTMVTGAALGVVGIGLAYKAINLALLHTLGFLRGENADEVEKEAVTEEQELMRQLETFTTTEINSVGEKGFVVDLAGVVLSAKRGMPIANATVKCAEFGSCKTDTEGRFIFSNIPLGTPYTITVASDDVALKPIVVSGVCGELEFLRIYVEEVGLS
jgi:hypothetical protein